ncbi:hypothetical protein CLV46_1019 [Diaminobutyricimonas aerilata]|uniref:Stage II sporulation protein M n=1 Tax=Diaminobutyricimonas aerilata TaxID=1162967 RepID=A0A2M9CHT5_9MICO|nr:hypothetical protein [Diaminobutyricimonas aerilata]PJJ71471.1 hypothetical protein CLV46_1019 [Diaminobutyricimonas aerilata]
MAILRRPFRIIRDHFRAYLVLNVVIYGACMAGMVVGMMFPDLTESQVTAIREGESADLIRSLTSTPALFALAIFANNLLRAGLLSIVLPSLVVPFSGIVITTLQVFLVGIILAPIDAEATEILLPHSVTLILEFQAYVVLALGAFVLGRNWLRPSSVGAPNRRQGYLRGLREIAGLGALALLLLLVGAVYEAISVSDIIG